jgi:hypothetical protein
MTVKYLFLNKEELLQVTTLIGNEIEIFSDILQRIGVKIIHYLNLCNTLNLNLTAVGRSAHTFFKGL